MKKWRVSISFLLFFSILFISLAHAEEKSLSLEYTFSSPTLSSSGLYEKVEMTHCTTYASPGAPFLPMRLAKILLPFNSEVTAISVQPSSFIPLAGTHSLLLAPNPQKINGAPFSDGSVPLYSGWYPTTSYEIVGKDRMRGYDILLLNLFPCSYNLDTQQLSWTKSFTVTISFTEAVLPQTLSTQIPPRPSVSQDRAILTSFIDNPAVLSTYQESRLQKLNGGSVDYLLITSDALVSDFEPLCSVREGQGLTTQIVLISDICDNQFSPYYQSGRDKAEQLRNFIKYAYTNWSTRYVLLGGDDSLIPCRYLRNPVESDPIPSDIYYSNLDGTFDDNNNNIFGESTDGPDAGDIDRLADLYVGRAPVRDSVSATNFVNKTIAYETSHTSQLKKALFIGKQLDYITEGGDAKDAIAEACLPNDWDLTRLYDRDSSWSPQAIVNALQEGTHLLNNLSHGDSDDAFGLTLGQIANLTNTTYFIGYSQGCYEGAFDRASTCAAESFLASTGGAAAYIANTRYGWYYSGDAVVYGPSQIFDMAFFDFVFNQNVVELGEAFYRSKEQLVSPVASPYNRYIYYETTLFGDPVLTVAQRTEHPSEELSGSLFYSRNNEIWSNNLETNISLQLTHLSIQLGPGILHNPLPSFDGSKIIFSYKKQGEPDFKLYSINSDGSGLEDLTSTLQLFPSSVNQTAGTWSPDGSLLLFSAYPSGSSDELQLWLKELDGLKRLLQLTNLDGTCETPLFIDNGRILFTFIAKPTGTLQDYYTIFTNGSGLTNLTNNNNYAPYFPRLGRPMLSLDRQKFIYAQQTGAFEGYSDWKFYTRSFLPGAPSTLILDSLYFDESPDSQSDPEPLLAGDHSIAFVGKRAYESDKKLFLTRINALDPYQVTLADSIDARFPFYLPNPSISASIAFIDGKQVKLMDSSSAIISLTDTPHQNHDPAFSSNGKWLAYAGNGIWIVRSNGKDALQIDDSFDARYPAFSPDNQWILYVKENDLYCRRRDLSLPEMRLTSTPNIAKMDPSFTPDASRIIYTSSTATGLQIFALPITLFDSAIRINGTPINLTNTSASNNFHPSISPDGATIAFCSSRQDPSSLYLMDADGGNQRSFNPTPPPSNPGYPVFNPWTGNNIAYLSSGSVWIADIHTGHAHQVDPTLSTNEKISWGKEIDTSLSLSRSFPMAQIDPAIPFWYELTLSVDENDPPSSPILITETLPTIAHGSAVDWVLEEAYLNGEELIPPTHNGANTGTIQWLLGDYSNPEIIKGSVLRLKLSLIGDNPSGDLRFLNGGIVIDSSFISTTGDSYLTLGDPFFPFDTNQDFDISDEELLLVIDYWAMNSRLNGWPLDLADWDSQLLLTIHFWVVSGYTYDQPGSSSAGIPKWKGL
ncbi:MAG: C25 family cysteine peptidase [Candidatus Ratteibacteria bacterium]